MPQLFINEETGAINSGNQQPGERAMTPSEITAWQAGIESDSRIAYIKGALAELDARAMRPMLEIVASTATDKDHEILDEINAEKRQLRAELAQLEGV